MVSAARAAAATAAGGISRSYASFSALSSGTAAIAADPSVGRQPSRLTRYQVGEEDDTSSRQEADPWRAHGARRGVIDLFTYTLHHNGSSHGRAGGGSSLVVSLVTSIPLLLELFSSPARRE